METPAETLLEHSLNLYALMEFGSRMKLLRDDKRFKQSKLLPSLLHNHHAAQVRAPAPAPQGPARCSRSATWTPAASARRRRRLCAPGCGCD
eukprot:COSAG03_NODE_8083_length_838_cov_2.469553_2_plen_92_part_00